VCCPSLWPPSHRSGYAREPAAHAPRPSAAKLMAKGAARPRLGSVRGRGLCLHDRKLSLAISRQSFAWRMTKGRRHAGWRFLPLCATGSASFRSCERRRIEPIERLGPVSFTHCCASTPGLSTWWSTTALRRDLVLREASRLDAFSGYPVRT
jgi:hypothetical protein